MNFKIVIPDGIDLRKTMECGQVFRYFNVTGTPCEPEEVQGSGRKHISYFVISSTRAAVVTQYEKDPDLDIHPVDCGPEGLNMTYWANYFRSDCSMRSKSWHTVRSINDVALMNLCVCGDGIRILKQEPWETLLSFIVSQRNSIPRIKECLNKIAECFGMKYRWYGPTGVKAGKEHYCSLPTPEMLLSYRRDEAIKILKEQCRVGYRAEYIYDTAMTLQCMVNNSSRMCSVSQLLHRMQTQVEQGIFSSDDLVRALQKFKGVGPKVAECTALFGFGCLDRFPVDVWIERAIGRLGSGFDPKKLGDSAGLIQQYMYWHMISHKDK